MIMEQRVPHGLTYDPSTTNKDFQLETIGVRNGIFPMFYEAQTSNVLTTAINPTLNISSLLGYSTDIYYQYQLVKYGDIKTLSSLAAMVTDRPNNHAWQIIGIPATTGLNDFLNLHANFLNIYEEVQINPEQYHRSIFETSPSLRF